MVKGSRNIFQKYAKKTQNSGRQQIPLPNRKRGEHKKAKAETRKAEFPAQRQGLLGSNLYRRKRRKKEQMELPYAPWKQQEGIHAILSLIF